MRLISLQLCNFRQFYGQTPIIQLASGQQNTTVIHGNNGAGKTTLLNAFTWVLYTKFTAALASPELLINNRAIREVNAGAAVECWVELQFEHENKHYQLKRKCYGTRNKNNQVEYSPAKLFMLVTADDGRWYPPIESPEEIIARILPESLHQYFFFDGERIDHFFRAGQNKNIAEDTKELLGVKILDRAIEHLKKAKKSLQEELQAIGDSEIKRLLQEQIQLEQESDRLTQRQQEITQNLHQLEQQKQLLTTRLLDLSGADELQKLKDTLVKQEKTIRHNLVQRKIDLQQLISRQSHTAFLSEITNDFGKLLEDLRRNNQLNAGIKQDFIQQLLKNKQCICGRDLCQDSDAHNHVLSWLKQAERLNLEEEAIRLEIQVNKSEQQLIDFWSKIDQEQNTINQQYREKVKIESELEQINKKLRNYPDKKIPTIQISIENIEAEIKKLLREQGANQQQLEIQSTTIISLKQKLNKDRIKEDKQALAKKRIQTTEEVITRLIEVRLRIEKQFRISLEQKVQDIFKSISFTPYIARLSSNYELTLVENNSGAFTNVAASTGENQILSLSFIGGIIDRVREWSQRNTLIGIDSSTFPIVMDSPFGSLDSIYRQQVAKFVPQLANQLVLLVTKTQWLGEVNQEIYSYIGKQYVLAYRSPKSDCEEDWLELDGINYPLVQYSNDEFEYTEILEI